MKLLELVENIIDALGSKLIEERNIEEKKEDIPTLQPGTIIIENGKVFLKDGTELTGQIVYNGNAKEENAWTKTGIWVPGVFRERKVVVLSKEDRLYVTFLK